MTTTTKYMIYINDDERNLLMCALISWEHNQAKYPARALKAATLKEKLLVLSGTQIPRKADLQIAAEQLEKIARRAAGLTGVRS